MSHRPADRVTWRPGPVGDAVRDSLEGRLREFIVDESSEPVVMFSPEAREVSDPGGWYGEHLGKWLVAASHAAQRTGDPVLTERIRAVVDFVSQNQEPSGYAGTYAHDAAWRMTETSSEKVRTWDVWVHAWTMMGLLRAGAIEPAVCIGELMLTTFAERSLLDLGNHAGLSSAVAIEPLAELTVATGDPRFADLAARTVEEMESRLGFLSKDDAAEIGTGKAYQLLWCVTGIVALYRATGKRRYLDAAIRRWLNIAEFHLSPLGGPWGGVAGHKEVFNAKGFFSPYGMTETCAAASWMALCRELFKITGEARFAAAFERTLLNTLLGALDENGRDWVYFTFPNGRRNNTYHWACCRSSGAMALEQASGMVATVFENEVFVNLLHPAEVQFEQIGLALEISERAIHFKTAAETELTLKVRVPEGAQILSITLNGEPNDAVIQDGYLQISREWATGDELSWEINTPIRVVPLTYSVDHHGQEVVRMDYAYVARGPWVYATGLIDGYRKEETLRIPRLTPEAPFRLENDEIRFYAPGRTPILFLPYYRAGGRHEGAWRTTWLQIAWQ